MIRLLGESNTLSRWMEGLFPPAQVQFVHAQYGVGAFDDFEAGTRVVIGAFPKDWFVLSAVVGIVGEGDRP